MALWKKILIGVGTVLGVAATSLFGYGWVQARAFDQSVEKVYAIPLQPITLSTDPAVLARGKHLGESVAPCAGCHGSDLGGGNVKDVGPIMRFAPPNITRGGLGAAYTDAELFRLLRHGVKKDGRTVLMMQVADFNWLPDSDLIAVISWVRSMPAVDRTSPATVIRPLGKVLDRRDAIPMDVARRIDHDHIELGPAEATPTAEYGRFLANACNGCHGKTFSGGHIPGTPPKMASPLNLTPHETGLKGWTYDDFVRVLETGTRRDGRKLDSFMPSATVAKLNDTEKRALFAYLMSLPPTPYGGR
jgi:mono/diheme cytochrome c family protein